MASDVDHGSPNTGANSVCDSPLDMLVACHDKARHFAVLTQRLGRHIGASEPDAETSDAANDILRYFDIVAPMHHRDEEEDLFPALRRVHGRFLGATIDALEAEHRVLDELWRSVRSWLKATAYGQTSGLPGCLDLFVQRYVLHIEWEESELYVVARMLPREVLVEIGRRICDRRS